MLPCNTSLPTQFKYTLIISCQGGPECKEEVAHFIQEHLGPSPKKHDLVWKHKRGPNLHSEVVVKGVARFMCSPNSGCMSHQRAFKSHNNKTLFRMYLERFPHRRNVISLYLFLQLVPFWACAPAFM